LKFVGEKTIAKHEHTGSDPDFGHQQNITNLCLAILPISRLDVSSICGFNVECHYVSHITFPIHMTIDECSTNRTQILKSMHIGERNYQPQQQKVAQ